MNDLNRDNISVQAEEETGSGVAQPNRGQPFHEPRLVLPSSTKRQIVKPIARRI